MKTKYFILIIYLLVTACDNTWLEPKPLSINTPESIYVDKVGLESVLLKLRKDLRNDFFQYNGTPHPLTLELISSDIGVAGEQRKDMVINHDLFSTPTNVSTYKEYRNWELAWAPIRDANVIISRIEAPEWKSEKDKNEILGEAYFHRAYWYYRLVHQFGDVPFLNKEYKEPKLDFFSHSRKTILKKIQTDLEFAVQWLPEVVKPGKVNRAAGYHLLTKVYLANCEFNKAITAADAVINSGKFALMTQRFGSVASNKRFNVIWDLHQRENKSIVTNTEGILMVQNSYSFLQDAVGAGYMSIYSPWWSSASWLKDPDGKRACVDTPGNWQIIAFGRGVGMFRPCNYFNYDIWKDCAKDLRHDQDTNWVPTSKIMINNPASKYYGKPVRFKDMNTTDTLRAWFPWPQYKVYVYDDATPNQPRGGVSDWYVYRLAETFLLRAEAYYWTGDLAKAAIDINRVRVRALAPLIAASAVNIGYILDERARELYLEEPRKCELTRIAFIMAENNLNGYSMKNFHQKNYWFDRIIEKNTFYNIGMIMEQFVYKISPYHVLWPIPQSAIDANTGGRINQNVGYFGFEKNITAKTEITKED
jgi:hypothetical protein